MHESTEETDYPAAHSMDVCWFASDKDGNVAMFSSREAGAVPKEASSHVEHAIFEELQVALGHSSADAEEQPDADIEDLMNHPEKWLERNPIIEQELSRSTKLGLYSYVHESMYENWISGPYERSKTPDQPINVSQLPDALRQKLIKMPNVSFKNTEELQPAELMACDSWEEWFVTLDGKVKPLPDTPVAKRALGWMKPAAMLAVMKKLRAASDAKKKE